MMKTNLPLWSLPLLLPTLVSAQNPIDSDPERPNAPAIQLEPGTSYLRASSGRIGIDPYLDAVLLVQVGSTRSAVYMQDPTQHNVTQPIVQDNVQNIVDVAVLNGGNGVDRDPILVLRSTGLEIYECAPGVNSQMPVARPILTNWAGAQSVWTGRKADGQPVVLGLSPDGTKITKWDWTGGNLNKLVHEITVNPGIIKMMTVNYDGVGDVEIVVQYGETPEGTNLYVIGWDGTIRDHLPFAPGPVNMTVSRGNGMMPMERDMVVASGNYTIPLGGAPSLLFLFNDDHLSFYPFTIESPDLTAVDWGPKDGLEDLVFADGENSMFHVFVRSVGTGAINPAPISLLGVVNASWSRESGMVMKVVAGDLDNDGDGDLLGFQNLAAGPVAQMVFGRYAPMSRAAVKALYQHVDDNRLSGLIYFDLPLQLPELESFNSEQPLLIEVTTWFKPTAAAPYEIEGTPTSHPMPTPGEPLSFVRPSAGMQLDWCAEIRVRIVATVGGLATPLAPYRVLHSTDAAEAFEISMEVLQIVASGVGLGVAPGVGLTGDGTTPGGTGAQQQPPKRP